MVEDVNFPLIVIRNTIIIDPTKMQVNEIYCCYCRGSGYQIEKLPDGKITVLREWLK